MPGTLCAQGGHYPDQLALGPAQHWDGTGQVHFLMWPLRFPEQLVVGGSVGWGSGGLDW